MKDEDSAKVNEISKLFIELSSPKQQFITIEMLATITATAITAHLVKSEGLTKAIAQKMALECTREHVSRSVDRLVQNINESPYCDMADYMMDSTMSPQEFEAEQQMEKGVVH